MIVSSKQLDDAAKQIRSGEQRRLANGVLAYGPQLAAAAQLLRAADPVECNGLKEERPGFIEAEEQRGNALVFSVGIFASESYAISPSGVAERMQ
jgi:hypothetical protein